MDRPKFHDHRDMLLVDAYPAKPRIREKDHLIRHDRY
jgi:hypothetical protein